MARTASKTTKAAPAKAAPKKKDAAPAAEVEATVLDPRVTVLIEGLTELLASLNGKATAKPAKASKAAAEEPADDEPEGDEREGRIAQLESMTLAKLKKLAAGMEDEDGDAAFEEDDIAKANKASLIAAIIAFEFDDEDADGDEDEEDEDEEDEDEEEGYTREALQGMTLVQVKKIAREEYGADAGDLKGLDKDSVIDDYILAEGDEDEDEDEGDDEDEEYTREELEEMSDAELKGLAAEYDIKVKRGMKRDAIIDALMEAGEEDEDEDE